MPIGPFRPASSDFPLKNLAAINPFNTTISDVAANNNFLYAVGSTWMFRYTVDGLAKTVPSRLGVVLQRVITHGSRVIVVKSSSAYVDYSDDDGDNWTPATGINSSVKSIATNSNGIVVAATGIDMFYSVDSGATFSAAGILGFTGTPNSVNQVVRYYADIDTFVCLGGAQRLYTSQDGQNWGAFDMFDDPAYTGGNVVSQARYNTNFYFHNTRGDIYSSPTIAGPYSSHVPQTFYNQSSSPSSTNYDGRFLLEFENILYSGHKSNALQYSTNGFSFLPLNNPGTNTSLPAMQNATVFNNQLWVIAGIHIYRSLES